LFTFILRQIAFQNQNIFVPATKISSPSSSWLFASLRDQA